MMKENDDRHVSLAFKKASDSVPLQNIGVKVRLQEIEVGYAIAWIIKGVSKELEITEGQLIDKILNEYCLFRVFDAQQQQEQKPIICEKGDKKYGL